MSAPETEVERQARKHRASLSGMLLAGLFAAALFLAYLWYTTSGTDGEAVTDEETATTGEASPSTSPGTGSDETPID